MAGVGTFFQDRMMTMNKTKVRISPSLFDYRQAMARHVNDLRDEKLRIAALAETNLEPFTGRMDVPVSETAGLLTPPCIEILLPEFYLQEEGEIEGIIQMITSDFFGIADIYVTLRDEAGNLLEGGHALRDGTNLGCWVYLPCVVPVAGSSVTARAVAADVLGGMHIAEETVTLTDEYLAQEFHGPAGKGG